MVFCDIKMFSSTASLSQMEKPVPLQSGSTRQHKTRGTIMWSWRHTSSRTIWEGNELGAGGCVTASIPFTASTCQTQPQGWGGVTISSPSALQLTPRLQLACPFPASVGLLPVFSHRLYSMATAVHLSYNWQIQIHIFRHFPFISLKGRLHSSVKIFVMFPCTLAELRGMARLIYCIFCDTDLGERHWNEGGISHFN